MTNKSKTNKPVTIIGYVDRIDEKKRDAGIVITMDNDEEFEVELNTEGKRLMNVIGEKVQVSGIVTEIKGRKNRITVNKFEVLEYEETYKDDEDFEETERFDY